MIALSLGAVACGRLDFAAASAVTDAPAIHGPTAACAPPTWTQQPLPADITSPGKLFDIYSLAADDIYAVGDAGILHSTGDGTWQVIDQPKIGLYGVWGVGPGEVYVVGNHISGNMPAIYHIKNSVPVPESNPGQSVLNSAWSSSPTDVYAVGYGGLILHSHGDGVWEQQKIVEPNDLYQVWGSSATDIYVAGRDGIILHSTGDGTWSRQPTNVVALLIAIWGSGPRDVYAAGYSGTILHSTGDGVWTPQPMAPQTDLFAIWGAGPDKIYASGHSAELFYSCGNGEWEMVPTLEAASQYDAFSGTANDIYVAGTPGVILHGP